jgi:signal transduction histidine kinase
LRTRIVLMVAGTLFAGLLAAAVLVRQQMSQNIVKQKLATVEILTTSIVHDITYATRRGEQVGPEVVEKYMTYYRAIRDLTLYDSGMVATAASDPASVGKVAEETDIAAAVHEARPTLQVSQPRVKDFGVRSVSPILQGSRIVGAVAVDVSMQDVQQALSEMDVRLATMMAMVLGLVAATLYVLLRANVLVRLQRLMRATQEIRAGRYEVRIDDHAGDEIGSLAQALDSMTAELQLSRHQIENYNRQLEDRVREATSELAKAYENLKSAQGQMVLNEKMASLGVLISGVAHEINTPVGAILNVSRNLLKGLASLPKDLGSFRGGATELTESQVVACLEDLLSASCTPRPPVSYKVQRTVEGVLQELEVPDFRRRGAALCKLGLTDDAMIRRHVACFRDEAFFSLAESCANVAQAAMIAEASSQKIAEIVKALKYYAYSDKDRTEAIQINDSVATALVLLRNQLRHGVTLSADLTPDLPAIECSSDIHQIWTNLLTNAYDAVVARDPGTPGEIRVATRCDGGTLVVTVEDNGIGIPDQSRARIFDPFYTTKDIGKGTGLGLSIVSGIVKKHHGSIEVESQPGRTVFAIRLPMGAASSSEGSAMAVVEREAA